ncbi:MAG TPA: ATP-binding cassette domain-containing protein, partial [Solirubrobacterales bacterium]|nr:ATP-binding cassette domain-containing protein [Solirubrobacterales bacterium]
MGAATDKCGATDQGAAIDTDAAIEMRGVTVFRWSAALGRRTYLLRDLEWRVQPGEHWALLGPNGAGKSTLMQIAAATAQPSEGSVAVLGEEFGRADLRRLRERIGLVDERLARRLRPRLSAVEAVMTGAHGAIAPQPRRSRVDERARVEQERADERTRAGELLELIGLAEVAEREFGHCSQGERQRLLVARALMAEP